MRRSAPFLLLKAISGFPKAHRTPKQLPLAPPFSSFHPIPCPLSANGCRLGFATERGAPDHSREMDEINLKFAEAREEIEAAMESKETIYFDEEAECAREAVKTVLDMFVGLLGRLQESDRMAVQRSMGLKIEQLKAELRQLDD